ncbi:hypothetical protein [Brevundimonas sp.]|uniref:hypothetical protein n=1 Tax=Brevundimonas sp. TaxID=1871086 RepID=UPI002D3091C1|nr:hypothetical protein [Brevundimonas sp.]HYC97438.1 hypothetical protein [Brevundimonas sp.]
MPFIHKFAAAAIAVLALAGLGACATGPSLTPEQMAGVRAGEQSAIILSYEEYAGMYGAYVRFANVETGRLYQVEMHGGANLVNAGPDMVAAPPGRYRVAGGSLYTADGTGNMPLLDHWFEPFDLAAGEVVDLGTLHIDDVTVHAVPGMSERVLRALVTFNPNRTDRYLTYSVDYSDAERVRRMLASKYPTLGVTPVRRPLRVRLDRAGFERVVVEAYALEPDGSPPTIEEAQARVSAAMARFLDEGR